MRDVEEVKLKVADVTDAGKVLQLLRQINQETKVVMIANLDTLSIADEEVALAEINQRSDCFLLLAVQGDQPVGIVTVTKIDDGANAGELGVAVLKEFWSLGIGSLLVEEAIYWFENFSSLSHLVLDVFQDNERARRLYEKRGFIKTGETRQVDSTGTERPTIMMEYYPN